jgi:chromosome segregation ATPase
MISYLIAGAAAGIIGVISGQGLVLSAGRYRLAGRIKTLEQQKIGLQARLEMMNERVDSVEVALPKLNERMDALEAALPKLISRDEVERAFAQAAQIEAQRQAALQQQARQAAVFGGGAPAQDLNTQINGQLNALNERISRINKEFGLS